MYSHGGIDVEKQYTFGVRVLEHDKRFEAIERKLLEHDRRFNSLMRRITAIGARWGIHTETGFPEVIICG
jgi:hypothetical protein